MSLDTVRPVPDTRGPPQLRDFPHGSAWLGRCSSVSSSGAPRAYPRLHYVGALSPLPTRRRSSAIRPHGASARFSGVRTGGGARARGQDARLAEAVALRPHALPVPRGAHGRLRSVRLLERTRPAALLLARRLREARPAGRALVQVVEDVGARNAGALRRDRGGRERQAPHVEGPLRALPGDRRARGGSVRLRGAAGRADPRVGPRRGRPRRASGRGREDAVPRARALVGGGGDRAGSAGAPAGA